ncbi:cell division protein ZapD [Vibrio sp. WJH972]
MTTHKFEHPLNEKTRIYLRVESLLAQIDKSTQFSRESDYQLFFRSLFDLVDISEQIQLRNELAKDLDKQRVMYRSWLDVEGVDQSTLLALLNDIDTAHQDIMKSERFGVSLKEDRFLNSIKQRFSLPGGSCSFDLPALHYWLSLPIEQKQGDAHKWTDPLLPLKQGLSLWLKLARQTGSADAKLAARGFFQCDTENASMLRLDIPLEHGVFPMISGHKNRFAIKFIEFESGKATQQDIEFELAICS